MARLIPNEEERTVHASDVSTNDTTGLTKRGKSAATPAEDKPAADAAPAAATETADDVNKEAAAAQPAAKPVNPNHLQGWKRKAAMVGAWGFVYFWIITMVSLSHIVMGLYECSSAQLQAYTDFGIEEPLRYMITCDLNGAPDLSPYSLPDNLPPYPLPDPMCLAPCERAPIMATIAGNMWLPWYSTRHYYHMGKRIVFVIYRMVYRWGYRLYRNVKMTF